MLLISPIPKGSKSLEILPSRMLIDADIFMVGKNSEGDGTSTIPNDLSESKDLETVSSLKRNGKTVAAYVDLIKQKTRRIASKLGKVADYLILLGKDWTVIPFENIIAELQG